MFSCLKSAKHICTFKTTAYINTFTVYSGSTVHSTVLVGCTYYILYSNINVRTMFYTDSRDNRGGPGTVTVVCNMVYSDMHVPLCSHACTVYSDSGGCDVMYSACMYRVYSYSGGKDVYSDMHVLCVK